VFLDYNNSGRIPETAKTEGQPAHTREAKLGCLYASCRENLDKPWTDVTGVMNTNEFYGPPSSSILDTTDCDTTDCPIFVHFTCMAPDAHAAVRGSPRGVSLNPYPARMHQA